MNDEEKFVVKILKDSQNTYIENTKVKKVELSTNEAKVVLNLIEKQNKIIYKMAKMLEKDHEWFYSEFDNYTKQDFIEYFANKVEEDIKE